MSLFGESPPGTRPLFASPDFSGGSPSLFEDDPAAGDSGGAWAGAASTSSPRAHRSNRSQNLGDVVRELLTTDNANIPPAYYDIYEKLVSEFGDGADGKVEAHGAADRVLDEAEVYGEDRNRVWELIVGRKDLVGRGEIWCLLAMAGLVQEGDRDIGVDAVDVRRRNLPIPRLKTLTPPDPQLSRTKTPPTQPESAYHNRNSHHQHTHSNEIPNSPISPVSDKPNTIVARQQSTPISTKPVRTGNPAALFASSVEDPWGAPPPQPPNAVSAPAQTHQQRYGDMDGQQEETEEVHEPDDIHAALRNAGSGRVTTSSTWAGDNYSVQQNTYAENYNQSITGFGEHPGLGARHGSFGGLGGNRVNGRGNNGHGNGALTGLERVKAAMKAPEEHVNVNILPEKEGMFMFQHRNYQITSTRRGSRVVRRYSDFVWLLDCLHKRYPFRQLPLLPPKRLAVNGHYLSADAEFLERRRRGLHRFVNALVRHPTLSQEQLVIMFLTVPTELSVWRKQATFSIVEEFTNRSLPSDLEASLPRDLTETFETVRSGLRRSAEIYIQLCNLVERLERRHEGIAADYGRFATCLSSLTDASEATYAVDTNDIPLLNDGLTAVSKSLTHSRALLEDEAKAWDAGVLEDLKRQRDTLVSMRELFERYDRLAGNNIPQLTKRIENNQKKLETLRASEAPLKPGETEKVQEAIRKDGEDIERQRVRGILIRECILHELVFFQGSQYHVGRLHQDWAIERVKYAELQAEGWRALSSEVEGMPTGE
ncbi:hypothetical protein FN846DRAFT_925255 [Sphaerosporella brunnea]|uniref:Sorting nexin MVP1 n=1 Tax=Sphaerosporella brunnea TaxID=1250544 RepID=A0A5J5FB42_9PEZI|nr:hypothetical protein FN846DRAFT_925255 [Sphaerosporella brunnea]